MVLKPGTSSDAERALNDYVYAPISPREIRLFHMDALPRRKSRKGPITGTLRATSERQVYTTLSYAWGDSHADGSHLSESIVCDGQLLRITPSLKRALRRIQRLAAMQRYEEPTDHYQAHICGRSSLLTLWIDAICINQDDFSERSYQVQMMSTIFKNSSALLIWLGELSPGRLGERQYRLLTHQQREGNKESSLASLDCPPRGRHWSQAPRRLRKLQAAVESERLELLYKKGGGLINTMTDAAILASIVVRPWFSRRWIIQEVQKAPSRQTHILMGKAICRKRDFVALAKTHGVDIRAMSESGLSHETAACVLWYYDSSECSDPHDYVFALMYQWIRGSSLDVDYGQSVRRTYLNLVKRTAMGVASKLEWDKFHRDDPTPVIDAQMRYSSEDVLRYLAIASCKKNADTAQSMESWVPDWRVKTQYDSRIHRTTVEDILREEGHKVELPRLKLEIHIDCSSQQEHNYLRVTGVLLSRPSSRPVHTSESLGHDEWIEEFKEAAVSVCGSSIGSDHRIWITGMLYSQSWHGDEKALAFVLREALVVKRFNKKPVYLLQSCFPLERKSTERYCESTAPVDFYIG